MDFILLLKKIALGIVQGIAEIFPISSSGHLLIASNILGVDTNGLQLVIFLHLGSLVALIIYYRKDIANILVALWRFLFKKDRSEDTKYYARLFLYIVIGCIPAAIVGFTLGDIIDEKLSNLYFVFIFLIVTGTLLLFTKKLHGDKTLREMNAVDALVVGCFQGVGVLPGVSRSGSTIFGGKIAKLSQEEAAHFSFLLFLPVTAGSFLIEVIKLLKGIAEGTTSYPIADFASDAIAVVIAGVVTYLAVKFFFRVIKKGKIEYFAYYCYLVAIIGIIVCLCTGYKFAF